MTVIQTNNFTYRYGDFAAVRDLNMEVKQGEIFGFLGPNGAGKTTTIRALMNFLFPSEGTATILGWRKAAMARASRWKRSSDVGRRASLSGRTFMATTRSSDSS